MLCIKLCGLILLVINRSYSLGVNVEICPYVSTVVELNIPTAYCELFSAYIPTITLPTIMSLATVSMQNKSPSVPNGRYTNTHGKGNNSCPSKHYKKIHQQVFKCTMPDTGHENCQNLLSC